MTVPPPANGADTGSSPQPMTAQSVPAGQSAFQPGSRLPVTVMSWSGGSVPGKDDGPLGGSRSIEGEVSKRKKMFGTPEERVKNSVSSPFGTLRGSARPRRSARPRGSARPAGSARFG